MNLRRFDSLLSQCCFKKRGVMQTSRYADVALCRRRVMQTSRYADVALYRRRVMKTSRYADVALCRRRHSWQNVWRRVVPIAAPHLRIEIFQGHPTDVQNVLLYVAENVRRRFFAQKA